VSNSKWFKNTSIILFLNKKDLFEKKLEAGKKLSDYQKDYDGPNTLDGCSEYLKQVRYPDNDRFTPEDSPPPIPIKSGKGLARGYSK